MKSQTRIIKQGRRLETDGEVRTETEPTDEAKQKFIDSECDLAAGSILEECRFDWKIIQSKVGDEILLNFNFKDKSSLSLGDEPDYVIIKFWGAPYIMTALGKPIFREPFVLRQRIPLQSESGSTAVVATKAIAQTVGTAGKSGLWIMTVVRLVTNGALAEILGVLAFMQLVVYLPLISVKFPATANILYKKIVTITTFDVLPTDALYPTLFSFDEDKFEAYNNSFEDFDSGSTIFVMNLGSLFVLMVLILLQFPLYYIGRAYKHTAVGGRLQAYF